MGDDMLTCLLCRLQDTDSFASKGNVAQVSSQKSVDKTSG